MYLPAAFAPLVLLVALSPALADGPAYRAPMIQVGSGIETNGSGTINVLMRVEFQGVDVTGNAFGRDREYVARIRTDLAMAAIGPDRVVAYTDIEFAPFAYRTCEGYRERENWDKNCKEAAAFPVRYRRNVRLGNNGTAQISLMGFSVGTSERIDEKSEVFARAAIDFLGLVMSAGPNQQTRFLNFAPGRATVESGVSRRFSPSFKVQLRFGATGDISMGDMHQGTRSTPSARTDFAVFSEVSGEIRDFLRIFVRNGVNGIYGAHTANDLEYQLMAGVAVAF